MEPYRTEFKPSNQVKQTFQEECIMWITGRVLLRLEKGIKIPEAESWTDPSKHLENTAIGNLVFNELEASKSQIRMNELTSKMFFSFLFH